MANKPKPKWRVEALSSGHDRANFSCGKPSLDDFIRRSASQYDKRNIARTFVAVVPPEVRVIGYYSLATGSVAFGHLPDVLAKGLPRHPIPVAHLGRLAVDESAQGQRLGEYLLLHALSRCSKHAKSIGIHAVEVYALDGEAREFYLKYGFTSLVDDPLHLYLSMKAIRKLDLP